MRRLVGISSKTQKAMMALIAIVICLTSLHMAAAARIASLQRQQEKLESSAVSIQQSALSLSQSSGDTTPVAPEAVNAAGGAPKGKNSTTQTIAVAAAKPVSAATGPERRIIISIADRKLALLENGQVVKTYPIAVGSRHTPSPDGEFVVINRAQDPVYRHRDKEIPPGKDNPLGTRWMGLSLKGYGIHGTNVQSSVGKAASHGCFRMRKQDVEELYALVQVGDTVTVRRERDAMIARVFAAPAAEPALTGPPTSPPLGRWGGMTLAKAEAIAETPGATATLTTVETTEQ
ncbi:MAG TPA: L,D-transpeptidase [Candidatus Angelobacter sp.]|nr:L,D-transpeptidase [Candidatus Angelobacter sp.]